MFTDPSPFNNAVSGDEAFNQAYLMSNEWDYTLGMGSGGQTGMTPPPMSDGSWNQMLESVGLGWEGGMAPHGNGGA
jgi:hypothetical protein